MEVCSTYNLVSIISENVCTSTNVVAKGPEATSSSPVNSKWASIQGPARYSVIHRI